MVDPGTLTHPMAVQNPTLTKVVGEGYTETWPAASITWWCSMEAASAQRMERLAGAGSMATASHVLQGHYIEEITTRSRLTYDGRVFNVLGVQNVGEEDAMTRVFAEEVVT